MSEVWNTITGGLSELGEYVGKIKNVILDFKDILITFVNLMPSPFKEILLTFIVILIAIMVYRTIKG